MNSRPTIFFLAMLRNPPPLPTQNPAYANATATPVRFSLKMAWCVIHKAANDRVVIGRDVVQACGIQRSSQLIALDRRQSIAADRKFRVNSVDQTHPPRSVISAN